MPFVVSNLFFSMHEPFVSCGFSLTLYSLKFRIGIGVRTSNILCFLGILVVSGSIGSNQPNAHDHVLSQLLAKELGEPGG